MYTGESTGRWHFKALSHLHSLPNYPDIYKALQEKHVNYTCKESTGSGWIGIAVQMPCPS